MRKPAFLFLAICVYAIHGQPAAGAVTYLIFPLENLSNSQALSWIGEALAISIGEQLRMPGVEAFGHDERLNLVENADLPPNAALSRASMIHVAQQAAADRLVIGSFKGTDENLQVELRVLDVKTLKLGGGIATGGPLQALPQMENELAWLILTNSGLNKIYSRDKFRERTRPVPNAAFSLLVQSFGMGDPDEQAKLQLRAVDLYPDFAEAHARLGRYFFDTGDCANSIRHLESAGGGRGAVLDDQFKLGSCYLKQGDSQGAIRTFSAILTFVKSPQVSNNLAVAYLRKGDLTLAAQNLIEARDSSRSDSTILANLAIVRHLQEDQAAALSILEEAEKLNPGRGMIQFLMGIILKSQGAEERASAAMAQAKRLGVDPEKLQGEDPKSWARPFPSWSK